MTERIAATDPLVSRPPKASDISDVELLEMVRAVRGRHGVPCWSSWFDIRDEQCGSWPPKVVLAKLKSAVRRGLLAGCACGCRGDFEEPE